MIWKSSAPSNIALIKYMGKISGQGNVPTNSSLSWTLENLRTFVELRNSNLHEDSWQPLLRKEFEPLELSEKGRARFLKHLSFLKSVFSLKDNFIVSSANNFPSDCGLASSASSFAALTKAVYLAARDLGYPKQLSDLELAELSRQGSGSSCRSFFSPWSIWTHDGARAIDLGYQNLIHQAIVVEANKKEVSSSEAHLRVTTSGLFKGRIERAENRLEYLIEALKENNWKAAYEICWAEFWDMHALFETATPHFGYMSSDSLKVLRSAELMWAQKGDGPIVTMDAGANVHALWRSDQRVLASDFRKMLSSYRFVES